MSGTNLGYDTTRCISFAAIAAIADAVLRVKVQREIKRKQPRFQYDLLQKCGRSSLISPSVHNVTAP
eukprot:3540757-Rhodomonas_salina.5